MRKEELNLILKEGEGYNSIMHKYYFEHGHNNILKFFPDRIQIENIWSKPKDFILGKTIFRRNHIIADLFSRIHFGEKIGSGMQRIKEYCKAENAPFPDFHFTETHFYVVFKQSKEYIKLSAKEQTTSGKTMEKRWSEKWSEKWSEAGFSRNQIKIMNFIKENPKISRKELSDKLHINPSAIQKHIEKLKQKGIIKRVGPDKGGYWQIAEKHK